MATASAKTNVYSSGQMMVPENFAEFLSTQYKTIHDGMNQVPAQGLAMYKTANTSDDYVDSLDFVGLGTVPQNRDGDNIPFQTAIQGFPNRKRPVDYRLGIAIAKRLKETGKYGLIAKIQRALVTAGKDTIELDAVAPFNTTFSATVPFVCADGMNLCDTLRPREDGRGTWSNVDTSAALTENSLEAMDNSFAGTVNGKGMLRPLAMKTLVVPRALKRKALELTKSSKTPEDALNSTNVYEGRFTVKVWDYLTSNTAWFGTVDMSRDEYQLEWLWRKKQGIMTWTNQPDVTKQRLRMSYVTGCDSAKGIRGNAGA